MIQCDKYTHICQGSSSFTISSKQEIITYIGMMTSTRKSGWGIQFTETETNEIIDEEGYFTYDNAPLTKIMMLKKEDPRLRNSFDLDKHGSKFLQKK